MPSTSVPSRSIRPTARRSSGTASFSTHGPRPRRRGADTACACARPLVAVINLSAALTVIGARLDKPRALELASRRRASARRRDPAGLMLVHMMAVMPGLPGLMRPTAASRRR